MNKEHQIFKRLLISDIDLAMNDFYEYCSVEDLIRFLLCYTENGVVKFENQKVSLTVNGKEWIIENKNELFLKKQNKSWEEIPPDYKQHKDSLSKWSKMLN